MTCDIEQLAQHIYRQSKLGKPGRRFLVGVAGIPGSGKSTLAYPLTDVINRLAESEGRKEPVAICIGGDGWHLSQAQLRSMEVRPSQERSQPRMPLLTRRDHQDPDHLFARRGAHFTFDGKGYADFVATLDSAAECPFPLFSHREKDPVRDGGLVEAQHQIMCVRSPCWMTFLRRLICSVALQHSRRSLRLFGGGAVVLGRTSTRRADLGRNIQVRQPLSRVHAPGD